MTTQTLIRLPATIRRRRFTADERRRLAEAGIIARGDGAEIGDSAVVEQSGEIVRRAGEFIAQTAEPAARRFTVDEYYRMVNLGIIAPEERVELIEGEILEMSPIGSDHASKVDRLAAYLWPAVGQRAIVRVQSPIRLGIAREPQPDIALLRPRPDFYAAAHPAAPDILLLVEVAETSADYDRSVKGPLYAAHGIPEYWLVNLPERQVEVYRDPSPDGYRDARVAGAGDAIVPLAFPDAAFDVGELFG